MSTRKQSADEVDRRRVLKGAGLAVGAAAVTAASAAKDAVAAPAEDKPQHSGYRESEHVRTYYKLARF